MPHKKKFPKGKPIPFSIFFGKAEPDEFGYTSDDEREENRAWMTERERQKTASHAALNKTQTAVLLGEENDFRTTVLNNENAVRRRLEETISEELIDQEFTELLTARREEQKRQDFAKQTVMTKFAVPEMLNRSVIAEKETEQHISFFNRFSASLKNTKEAEKTRLEKEKLEADRKKAAERAKAYEERNRKANTEKPSLFQKPAAPAASETAADAGSKKAGGWFSWLSS